jgi:hypothetical protein
LSPEPRAPRTEHIAAPLAKRSPIQELAANALLTMLARGLAGTVAEPAMSDSSSEFVVSIAEAARRLGMSPVAVVRHIDGGQLQTRRVDHARGLQVVLPEALESIARDRHTSPENGPSAEARNTESQARVGRLVATLERLEANTVGFFRDAMAVLKEELAAKDRQLAQRDRQIVELHALLAASNSRSKAR